ncbi:uncharacterized protein N7483_002451 [Penicillium malachiteum]|uniref:uncharacterized protein n=1 Tax=Penicillium malachiteum TaxID=1324776 RepID=UPI002548CDC6|nr:uncharacterized protein N7483_002451 [Penicillium malachiteum]KAJ5737326.1 hypothetical protein N7483_002451 [Penicillium malachiteum]
MTGVQILIQVDGESFYWQQGFGCLQSRNQSSLERLLTLSKAFTHSIEWELLSADQKERPNDALQACSARLLSNAKKINDDGLGSFGILPNSKEEKNFISIVQEIMHPTNTCQGTNRYHESAYWNTLRLIAEYTSLAHVFLVVHSLSKKMFRKLGVNGLSKLVQYVSEVRDRLLCPALQEQVAHIRYGNSPKIISTEIQLTFSRADLVEIDRSGPSSHDDDHRKRNPGSHIWRGCADGFA